MISAIHAPRPFWGEAWRKSSLKRAPDRVSDRLLAGRLFPTWQKGRHILSQLVCTHTERKRLLGNPSAEKAWPLYPSIEHSRDGRQGQAQVEHGVGKVGLRIVAYEKGVNYIH